MPNSGKAGSTDNTTYTHPEMVFEVFAPRGWEEDLSGADRGVFIYLSDEIWNQQFRPNIVVIQRAAEPGTESLEGLARAQEPVEASYLEALADYRLLHLDADTIGVQGLPGLLRVASYKNPDDLPLTMFQWVVVQNNVQVDLTITYPTEMLGERAQLILDMGHGLLWKELAS
ncbi:hypothetical protein QDX21_06325 [Auritidibacter ignavus]|uniref:Uncharacterized protein n=1 Tax=Auritidibacter ignavus TaxID=678932 RepID=A0AAJ6AQC4_9MICC|nr:hypothetical protein [Auritidibacter ignavus]WGH94391.1 hypothetical protein QDX21_06325 [Auritidibacter ignavus]WHS27311.1 hypothetical protein QM395_07925 [Auritidibacter ignavus]